MSGLRLEEGNVDETIMNIVGKFVSERVIVNIPPLKQYILVLWILYETNITSTKINRSLIFL